MTRCIEIAGWLLTLAYFGIVAAFNVAIVEELLSLPSGFDPGWWPLIEGDALYSGGGVLVVLLGQAWRRWLSRGLAGHPLPL